MRDIIVRGGDLPCEDKATSPIESLREQRDDQPSNEGQCSGKG